MTAILTGSRAFGVAGHNSDTDWVSLDGPHGSGYGWIKQSYNINDGYIVFRRGRENWILCCTNRAMALWMAAHNHCMIERPRSKDRRKVIFDHYMYGTPLHRQTPLPLENRQWFARKHELAYIRQQVHHLRHLRYCLESSVGNSNKELNDDI